MTRARPWHQLSFAVALLLAATTHTRDGAASEESSLSLGSVESPPPAAGVDRAALKTAAEGELLGVDAKRLRNRRKVVVSVAVTGVTAAPVACTVNATLHDAKTGNILAILEGRARSDAGSANLALRKAVFHAALRNAIQQIPEALGPSH